MRIFVCVTEVQIVFVKNVFFIEKIKCLAPKQADVIK